MTRPFTVQCGCAGYYANTATVEADSLDEALEKAIEAANRSDAWRSLDHYSDTFVDAACEGADADPWATDASLPVPDRFTGEPANATGPRERTNGETPIVTFTDPTKPDGGIEITRGRVLLRFQSLAGRVTAEMRDSPHPPDSEIGTVAPVGPHKPDRTPLVTVRRGPDGRLDVTVTEGRARVGLLDE